MADGQLPSFGYANEKYHFSCTWLFFSPDVCAHSEKLILSFFFFFKCLSGLHEYCIIVIKLCTNDSFPTNEVRVQLMGAGKAKKQTEKGY